MCIHIQDFIKKHGDRYNYDLVKYVAAIKKVKVLCKIHGLFTITPNSHKNGSGCMECGKISSGLSCRANIDTFLYNARRVHGNRYIYTTVNYTLYNDKVAIICRKHGIFYQKPHKHYSGQNCKKCTSESYYIDFVAVCKEKFGDKYSYDRTVFCGVEHDVIITCNTHNLDFVKKARGFLYRNRGCLKCINRTISILETSWLDSLNIPIEKRNVYMYINFKQYCVDAYDAETNTIYEFNGDYFHGNPKKHNQNDLNVRLGIKFGDLYTKTLSKENIIKKAGYNLVVMWEYDYKIILKNK